MKTFIAVLISTQSTKIGCRLRRFVAKTRWRRDTIKGNEIECWDSAKKLITSSICFRCSRIGFLNYNLASFSFNKPAIIGKLKKMGYEALVRVNWCRSMLISKWTHIIIIRYWKSRFLMFWSSQIHSKTNLWTEAEKQCETSFVCPKCWLKSNLRI